MSKGEFIKSKRKNNGYTQKQLAIKIGISSKHLSDIECSRKNLSLKLLKKIIDILPFNKEEIDFLEREGNKIEDNRLDKEIKEKKEELLRLESEIKTKIFEFEKLERTSGIRSKVTWGSIEIQKFVASKIIEIMNIYSLANEKNKKECIPSLKQLTIYLDSFSQQLKKVILEEDIFDERCIK